MRIIVFQHLNVSFSFFLNTNPNDFERLERKLLGADQFLFSHDLYHQLFILIPHIYMVYISLYKYLYYTGIGRL